MGTGMGKRRKARAKTKQASRASNLRQIGLALLMHVEGYDGRLPLRPFCCSHARDIARS
jgi:hypothetical protein